MKTPAHTQSERAQRGSPAAHVTGKRAVNAHLHHSPRMVAQRQHLERTFGSTVQRQGPEEEELQLKATPGVLQRQGPEEEEELLQGKFALIQRQGPEEEEELIQGKFAPVQRQGGPEDDELVQGKFANGAEPTQLESDTSPQANRTGMPDQLKAGIEGLSGLDLSDVRVHYGSDQPARLNALAYTQGTDIHVVPGQEKHLPHEAWHVVQQAQGRVRATKQVHGKAINDNPDLENEADTMGSKAQLMGTDTKGTATSSTQTRAGTGGFLQRKIDPKTAEGTWIKSANNYLYRFIRTEGTWGLLRDAGSVDLWATLTSDYWSNYPGKPEVKAITTEGGLRLWVSIDDPHYPAAEEAEAPPRVREAEERDEHVEAVSMPEGAAAEREAPLELVHEAEEIERLSLELADRRDPGVLREGVGRIRDQAERVVVRTRGSKFTGVLKKIRDGVLTFLKWLSPFQDIVNGIALTIAGLAVKFSTTLGAALGTIGAVFGLFAVALSLYVGIRAGKQIARLRDINSQIPVLGYAFQKKLRQLGTAIVGGVAGGVAIVAGIGGAATGGAGYAVAGVVAGAVGAGLALYGWWRKTGAKARTTLTLLKKAAQDDDQAIDMIKYLIEGQAYAEEQAYVIGEDRIRRDAQAENTGWIKMRALGAMFGKGLKMETETGRRLKVAVKNERTIMAEYLVRGMLAGHGESRRIVEGLGLDPASLSTKPKAEARKKVAGALG